MFKKLILIALVAFSGSIVLASGGGGEASLFSLDMLYKGINFILLLILLHMFAKKPLVNMLSTSAKNTKESTECAKSKLKEAEKQLTDFQAKLANLETELEARRKTSLEAIEEEKNRIIVDANNFVKKLEQQSNERIEQDILQAKKEIRDFLINESVRIAEEQISNQIDDNKKKELIKNYNTQVLAKVS